MTNAVGAITPTEFDARQRAGANQFLLDVREAEEVAAASVAAAVHIPMGEVPARLAEIPRDRAVVVMCAAGMRSLRVAQYLVGQGYQDVANLTGGINLWSIELGL